MGNADFEMSTAQMYDPPRALTSVAGLDPITTAAAQPSMTAKPSAIPEVVPITSSPKSKPTHIPVFGSLPGYHLPDPDPDPGSSDPGSSDPGTGSSSGDGENAHSGSTPKAGSNFDQGGSQGGGTGGYTNLGSNPSDSGTASHGDEAGTGSSDQTKGSHPKGISSSEGHESTDPQHEHKHSSVNVGGVGIYVPTQGHSSAVFGHQTISIGGPAITIAHTPVSLGPSHLVVGGSDSHQLVPTARPANPSIIHIGGQSVVLPTLGGDSGVVIGSETASVGGPEITISNTPVSLAPNHLVVGSSSYALAAVPGSSRPASITIAGQGIIIPTQGASALNIGSQVIPVDGPAVTISDTPISLGSSALVVGTSTIPLPTTTPKSSQGQLHYYAIGSQTIAIDSAGIIIGSQTLHPQGPAITVSGTEYSLGTTAFVAGSLTETFPAGATPTAFRPEVVMSGLSQIGASSVSSVITVGDETIKLNPSNIVVHGTTLTPGASGITVDGTLVSLGTNELVVGSMTETLSNLVSAETSAGGLGAVIMSAFGPLGRAAATSSLDIPSGSAGVGDGKPSASASSFKGAAVQHIPPSGPILVLSLVGGLLVMLIW